MKFAAGDEQDVPGRLRDRGRLALSLIAEADGEVVGQVTFSRMLVSSAPSDWCALGPISVAPEHQGVGIGGQLIREGIAALEKVNAIGIALTGDPNYYRRFGFEVSETWAPPNEPAEYFQLLKLTGVDPPSTLFFDPAFYA
jgi:putative acetyltransferase